MSSVDSYCHRQYNGITLQGYAFTFHIQITPECVSLVSILSTNKIDLNLTLYSFVAKGFQRFLLLMFCPMVSLFHKCRKLCPISGSSHLIFFVLGIYFVREGSRQEGIVWKFKVSALLKFLQVFARMRKLNFLLAPCNAILHSYEDKISVWDSQCKPKESSPFLSHTSAWLNPIQLS